jgi:hypothetical protein
MAFDRAFRHNLGGETPMSEQDQKPVPQESELGPEELEKVNGGAKVSKVEALTIKQKVVENSLGPDNVQKT